MCKYIHLYIFPALLFVLFFLPSLAPMEENILVSVRARPLNERERINGEHVSLIYFFFALIKSTLKSNICFYALRYLRPFIHFLFLLKFYYFTIITPIQALSNQNQVFFLYFTIIPNLFLPNPLLPPPFQLLFSLPSLSSCAPSSLPSPSYIFLFFLM